ncbi:MAG: hypothetical protein U1E05_04335, partial [Patescibacteria group bacterium]|nr:hypothetical protein [Patescibacteria group bacterium]
MWKVFSLIAFVLVTTRAEAGLIAAYGHENATNRLQDDTGNGHTLTNVNTVTFVDSPANSSFYYFDVGDTVATYSGSARLQVPNSVYSGGSFTFAGLVNKGSGAGFQTILSSSRFRLQRAINTDWNSGNPVLNLSVVTGSTNNTWVACDFREA